MRVRDIYAAGAASPERVQSVVDDRYIELLAGAVASELGGRVGAGLALLAFGTFAAIAAFNRSVVHSSRALSSAMTRRSDV